MCVRARHTMKTNHLKSTHPNCMHISEISDAHLSFALESSRASFCSISETSVYYIVTRVGS